MNAQTSKLDEMDEINRKDAKSLSLIEAILIEVIFLYNGGGGLGLLQTNYMGTNKL